MPSPSTGAAPAGPRGVQKGTSGARHPFNSVPVVLSKCQARCCHLDGRFCQLFPIFGPFLAGVTLTFAPNEVLPNLIKSQILGRPRVGTGGAVWEMLPSSSALGFYFYFCITTKATNKIWMRSGFPWHFQPTRCTFSGGLGTPEQRQTGCRGILVAF